MRQFLQVLKKYASPYKRYMAWAIVLNIFSAVFNIFSFTLIIPLLQILFKIDSKVYEFIPWGSDVPLKDMILNNIYYYMTVCIDKFGGSMTLIIIGLFISGKKVKNQP